MKLPDLARISIIALSALAPLACSLAPVGQPTDSPSPAETAAPTDTPKRNDPPTAAVTPSISPTESSTHEPYFIPPKGSRPPKATLSVGAVSVEASALAYCWSNECLDGPNPPKDQLPELNVTESGLDLEFSVGDGARFARWFAEYYDLTDDDAVSLGNGGFAYDPDVTPATPWVEMSRATFPAPLRGDWVVNVSLELVHGDLSYGWHVVVP